MRSPYDTSDGKEFYRDPTLQAYMECTDIHLKKKAFMQRFLGFFSCKRKKKKQLVEVVEKDYVDVHPDVGRLFSFSEVELDKIGPRVLSADVAVQTGSSLEMPFYEGVRTDIGAIPTHSSDTLTNFEGIIPASRKLSLDLDILSNQPSDELSILKFFRRARSVSMQMSSIEVIRTPPYKIDAPAKRNLPQTDEKEIQVLLYDEQDHLDAQTSTVASASLARRVETKPSHVRKKLRFDEKKNVQSPSIDYDSPEEESVATSDRPRRSTGYTSTKNVRIEEMEPESVSDIEEPTTSTNREFKSYFWSSGKNKPKKPPAKKKAQLSLR